MHPAAVSTSQPIYWTGESWDCEMHSGLMWGLLILEVWFCFDSLHIGIVLAGSLWKVSRLLALPQICIWCIVSVCTSAGGMKNGVYSGVQSMNSLVWLADWDWDCMCLACVCHEVLGDTLGFLQTLSKFPMILQLWHSLLTAGHLDMFLCACGPSTEEAFRVVRLCGLSTYI